MPKEKLTLTVDSEVLEKAKALRLNISELTEKALKSFAYSPKEADRATLYRSYEALFASMKPLLEKFGTSVKVASYRDVDLKTGSIYGDVETFMNRDGSFWTWAYDEVHDEFSDITKIPIYQLNTPKEILSNLFDALVKATERDKETLRELEIVRRITDAATATMLSRETPKSKRGHKRRAQSRSRVT